MNKNWWELRKGMGVRFCIVGDVDEFGKQKLRPGIIIKTYPSHIKVQLMTTESTDDNWYELVINNTMQYIRSIYCRSIKIDEIKSLWMNQATKKPLIIDTNSKLFQKIAEMELREISGENISIELFNKQNQRIKFLEEKNKDLKAENMKLKNKIDLSKRNQRTR